MKPILNLFMFLNYSLLLFLTDKNFQSRQRSQMAAEAESDLIHPTISKFMYKICLLRGVPKIWPAAYSISQVSKGARAKFSQDRSSGLSLK